MMMTNSLSKMAPTLTMLSNLGFIILLCSVSRGIFYNIGSHMDQFRSKMLFKEFLVSLIFLV